MTHARAGTKRLFVSVPVDCSLLKGPFSYVADTIGMRSSPENAHITILFIGDRPTEDVGDLADAISESVSGMGRFEFTLRGVGRFPGKGMPRVLWVGAEGDGFVPLHEAVSKAVGMKPDARFVPHVTLCRIRGKAEVSGFLEEFSGTVFGKMVCDSVHLMESELTPMGARHKLVRKIDC